MHITVYANERATSTHKVHCYALLTYAAATEDTQETPWKSTHTQTFLSGTCGSDACGLQRPAVDTVLSCHITHDDTLLTFSAERTLWVNRDMKGAVRQLNTQRAARYLTVTAEPVSGKEKNTVSAGTVWAQKVCVVTCLS